MARRRTRYRTRTKTIYRRARSAGGSMKPIIDGALGGIVGAVANKYMPGWGGGLGLLGVGYFRNNSTLKVMGGVQVGLKAAGMIPFLGTNGTTGNGIFEG